MSNVYVIILSVASCTETKENLYVGGVVERSSRSYVQFGLVEVFVGLLVGLFVGFQSTSGCQPTHC